MAVFKHTCLVQKLIVLAIRVPALIPIVVPKFDTADTTVVVVSEHEITITLFMVEVMLAMFFSFIYVLVPNFSSWISKLGLRWSFPAFAALRPGAGSVIVAVEGC